LQPRIVIRVEVVQADDLVAAGKQHPRHVEADEAGIAGDQYSHVNPFGFRPPVLRCRLPAPRARTSGQGGLFQTFRTLKPSRTRPTTATTTESRYGSLQDRDGAAA